MGWIALHSGMAAGAHAILIPEQKTSMDQIATWVQSVVDRGRAPLVVAEGFHLDTMDDAHSERGLDARLRRHRELIAPEIEARVGIETRATTRPHPARRHPDRLRPCTPATRFTAWPRSTP
jgi:6-phosphofructokinase 1